MVGMKATSLFPKSADRLNDTLLSALAAGGSHGYGKPREAFRVMVDARPDRTANPQCRREIAIMDSKQPPPD